MTPLVAILIRDMRIAVRVGGGALMGVLFFLVVVTLIPFALGPDLALLKRIGPAILWLAALLALFALGVHLLVINANRSVPPQLETGPFLALLLGFAVVLVAWIGVLARRFRRD